MLPRDIPAFPIEEWRPIPGFDGWYDASSEGRIRSWHNNRYGRGANPRQLKQFETPAGYFMVNTKIDGRRKGGAVSRLVCAAFHGQPPSEESQAAHLDGNPKNNTPANLAWASPTENNAHKLIHGTLSRGEHRPMAKLSEADVIDIRARLERGDEVQKDIARQYGIAESRITKIKQRVIWKHVA